MLIIKLPQSTGDKMEQSRLQSLLQVQMHCLRLTRVLSLTALHLYFTSKLAVPCMLLAFRSRWRGAPLILLISTETHAPMGRAAPTCPCFLQQPCHQLSRWASAQHVPPKQLMVPLLQPHFLPLLNCLVGLSEAGSFTLFLTQNTHDTDQQRTDHKTHSHTQWVPHTKLQKYPWLSKAETI